jgi:hypothetical protein
MNRSRNAPAEEQVIAPHFADARSSPLYPYARAASARSKNATVAELRSLRDDPEPIEITGIAVGSSWLSSQTPTPSGA